MAMWKTRITRHVNIGGLVFEVPERSKDSTKNQTTSLLAMLQQRLCQCPENLRLDSKGTDYRVWQRKRQGNIPLRLCYTYCFSSSCIRSYSESEQPVEQKEAQCLQFDKEGEMLTAEHQPCVEKAAVTVKEMREMNVKTSYFALGKSEDARGQFPSHFESSCFQKCKFL